MEAETMAAMGWSSLPADIVNRVSDSLLATNDVDCYTVLRAVCHHWRSVTADPASNPHDPRFRPTQWIMLDEHNDKLSFSSTSRDAADDTHLFVNTSTGRFLRKSLPFHRVYHHTAKSIIGFGSSRSSRPPVPIVQLLAEYAEYPPRFYEPAFDQLNHKIASSIYLMTR